MTLPESKSHSRPAILNDRSVATILKGHEEFRLDIFGKIISSNLEAVNVTGYEEWEVIGKQISLFYTPEALAEGKVEHDLEKARKKGKYCFSSMMVKKRHVAFWAKLTIRCIYDGSEAVIGYKVVLKDQTHRLISNSKLKKFKSEYRNLFDNPFIGIFKFRKEDNKILLLNNKAEHIIGDAAVSNFDDIFLHPDRFDTLINSLDCEKKIVAFEFQLAHSQRWARIDCQWFDDEGFVEGVISDVTDSKLQLLELERLNSDLDNFIYRASHDLRSPLTTLMGLINLLTVDTDTPPAVYYEMMRDRVTHLDHLLADLAAITYNNKAQVTVETLNVDIIKEEILREFGRYAQISFSCDLRETLTTDASRLLTIFKKIAAYSIRYNNPAKVVHKLAIEIQIDNGVADIKFRDNGRGISTGQLAKVFDLFHKPTSDVLDTGLGLYVTKMMVEKLNGTIAISSSVGEGSEVFVSIPDLT
jgi:PAS domain S-box-containing protein